MYRCSIREKLVQNCNGFFITHRYPPFLNSDKDKEFSFIFQQQRETFLNTDTRRFKTETGDVGPPSPLARPLLTRVPIYVVQLKNTEQRSLRIIGNNSLKLPSVENMQKQSTGF